jgi:hypothetical protein
MDPRFSQLRTGGTVPHDREATSSISPDGLGSTSFSQLIGGAEPFL